MIWKVCPGTVLSHMLREAQIVKSSWLHARHGVFFVRWVNRFKSTIWKGEQKFSAASLQVVCVRWDALSNATRVMLFGLKAPRSNASHRANGAPCIAQYSWTCPLIGRI